MLRRGRRQVRRSCSKTMAAACAFFVFLGCAAVMGAGQDDAGYGIDAGDARGEALFVGELREWSGALGGDDEEDWYMFSLVRGAILSVALAVPDTANLDLYVYPFDRNTLVSSTYGLGIDESIEPYAVGEAGTCRVRIVLRDGNGSYRIAITVREQDDAGCGTDAGNWVDDANVVPPGTYFGELIDSDDADWYVVDCLAGQVLSAYLLIADDVDFDLSTRWIRYTEEHGGLGRNEQIECAVPRDGPVGIGVLRREGEGPYELGVAVRDQNDAGSGRDAGNDEREATAAPSGGFTGYLGPGDGEDWYGIEMAAMETLALDFSVPEQATFTLSLYPPWGTVGHGPVDGGVYDSGDHLRVVDRLVRHNPGTWLLHVGRRNGAGTYELLLMRQSADEDGRASGNPPEPDGVSIPLLRQDPTVASGSTCRGACGSGCPDTCIGRSDIVRCLPEPADDGAHRFVRYANVIECGTHAGCRDHDDCFDACVGEYGEESLIGPCHDGCSAQIVDRYGVVNGASWALGYGPYDGYLLYSDPPVWSAPEPGRLEFADYRVDVYTGDIDWTLGEGTDARVYLTLLGSLFGMARCSSVEVRLDTPDLDDFETGQHNTFFVTAERFESLDGIVLRHDGTGLASGWYVDHLEIRDVDSGRAWRIDAHRWIAFDEEDGHLRAEFDATSVE